MRKWTKSALLLAAAALLSSVAVARHDEDAPERSQTNRDIWVQANQKAGDLSCFNCSVHVRGQVNGDVVALHGNVMVETGGQVAGDVAAILGDVRVEKTATIGGDVAAIGGKILLDPEGSIGGDRAAFNKFWVFLIVLFPFFLLGLLIALIVWLVQRRRRPAALPA